MFFFLHAGQNNECIMAEESWSMDIAVVCLLVGPVGAV